MTRQLSSPRVPGGVDVPALAGQLLDSVMSALWGQISPSFYETGRLVTVAPWLAGHGRRVEYLVAGQRPDGGWGGPDGYALVPTLSATEALLTVLTRDDMTHQPDVDRCLSRTRLIHAARHGLRTLFGWLTNARQLPIPDTPAIEIIVPSLVASLNEHLSRLQQEPPDGFTDWFGDARLRMPAGMDGTLVAVFRAHLADGDDVPAKLLHSLEVGDLVVTPRGVRPVPPGTVGASPAATAAWLASTAPARPDRAAVRYLEDVAGASHGPVPSVTPITMFERAWVVNSLVGAGVPLTVPIGLVADLAGYLGSSGTPGGAGLPADADSTAGVLFALAQLGVPADVDCLWPYQAGTHFCAWHGERTASPTVNAHVLEAFGSRPDETPRHHPVFETVSGWLCDRQQADGSWTDKWHASPYYATAACSLALHRFGVGRAALGVSRAAEFVRSTQLDDGSWGRWGGTAEETAYALQVLLLTGAPLNERATRAAAHGYRYLRDAFGALDDPPLWHDKDLYRPGAVVRAAILAAVHLAQREPAVMALALQR